MSDAPNGLRPGPRSNRRGLVALLLSTTLATCTTDHTPTGPGHGGRGFLAIRPVLAAPVNLAAFNLTIDGLRVIAIRPPADTAADTTIAFPADSGALHLALPIILKAQSESFTLVIQLRAGTKVLFSGTQTVQVSVGPPDTASTATIPLSYVGPGAGITHIHVTPQDSVVNEGGTQLFRAVADSNGVPVDSFFVSWSTSDTIAAKINGQGLLRAPTARGAVFVRATTPNSVKDSTRITFIPTPAALTVASGNGQTGTVNTRLALPLRVQVTASDALGIKGVPVKFEALSLGGVQDSIVATDSAGFAADTVTLGTTSGPQLFRATVASLKPDTFTVTASAGAISAVKSVVTVSSPTVPGGTAATLTLQAKDAFGNNLTTGGAKVVFAASGGTSTGQISTTTDHGDGTYTAFFTGLIAGTATTVGATVNGAAVTTTLPTITVTAGAISRLTSVVTTSAGTVSSGSSATLTLQGKDSAGNLLTTGGAVVVFSRTGGTSTGTIGATTDHGNGSYTATFTGDTAGTATTIHATIGGIAVTSTTTITVVPGNTVAARSVITVSQGTIPLGGTSVLTLQAKDSAGNNLTTGGLVVVFSHAGGTSGGAITPSPATDNKNGTYTATFMGDTAGTATTIHATIGGVQVTSTLPTITVFSSVHVSDITADSTWTAAGSPHVVNGYLRVLNGAKLTIQAGAVVKFNAGAGLQIGDTATNSSGGLILDGTGPGITLTANTATPVPGFWKGIEVQRNIALTAWRRALIEWAGGTRTAFGGLPAEACILFVNRSGAEVDLDSLRIRQCVHAGVHHFGGVSHIHRSEIDSVTGSGIHADLDAQLQLDSNTVRGSGQEGLLLGNAATRLLPSTFNRFVGNATFGIQMQAFQLPSLLRQDSIAGNGTDFIVVNGGQPDPTVAAFTILAQPQRAGSNGYLIQNGLLNVGRVGGQAVTLDSNLVLRFTSQSGLVIGDSAGTRSGSIVSRGTNRTNAPRLTSASLSPAPGDWYGLEIGRLASNTRLANVRVEFAGDSIPGRSRHRFGLAVRSPAPQTLSVDSVIVTQSGRTGSDTNTAGIGVLAGGGGVDVRRSVALGNLGYGLVVTGVPSVKLVDDTARLNTIGFGIFSDSMGTGALTPADSVARNVASGNTLYPLSLDIRRLPVLYANAFAGNGRDTAFLHGGTFTSTATLPHFAGVPWHVRGGIQIDSGGTLTIAAGDTLAFDVLQGIVVGASTPAALALPGTAGSPILLTASFAPAGLNPFGWGGIEWRRLAASGNAFTYVTVDKAGYVLQTCIDCSATPFGALQFADTGLGAATGVSLTLDHVIVRGSFGPAIQIRRVGTGTISFTNSQFYGNNGYDPMISAFIAQPNQLSITGSDLYHYRRAAFSVSAPAGDSVVATGNWWGDVAGPDPQYGTTDSLGRTGIVFNQVRYIPFLTSPVFPVVSAVAVVATQDTLLSPALSTSDSIRVRAVDAVGRGVAAVPISWSAAPSGTSFSPVNGSGDGGGRFDVLWQFTTSAGTKIATASGPGSARYIANVQPGLTTAEGWALDPARSQGSVTAPKAITFTSTNRRGVIVTNAHDQFNNPTQPSTICFTTPNNATCGFPYGLIDSTHTSGGASGDTVFFHATVTTPSPFILRAVYAAALAPVQDSVLIVVNPVIAGVKIDRDPNISGVQATPDTVLISALCPTGAGNFACQGTYTAFLVDSGLTALPSGNAFFVWHLVSGTAVSFDSQTAVFPHDIGFVTARANGVARIAVKDTSGNNFGSDTLPILVQQRPFQILFPITPDTVSLLVGGTTIFRAAVTDQAGDTMPAVPIHWRATSTINPHITIVDTSVANQAKVRLDSTPFGFEDVTAFVVRGPGDTIFSYASVQNPATKQFPVGALPVAIGASSSSNMVYVAHQGGRLYVVNGATDALNDSVVVGKSITALVVNTSTNHVFVANDTGIAVVDGTTHAVITTVNVGVSWQGVAVDSVNNRVYVASSLVGASPRPVLRQIDGATNTLNVAADVALPAAGKGVVFNPNDGLVYVTIPDSGLVVAVDPVGHSIVKRIVVPMAPFSTALVSDIAINPVTNRLYVLNRTGFTVQAVDPVAGAIVSTVSFFYSPAGLAVDPVNNRVYVGVSNIPYLIIIDGATNVIRDYLTIGNTAFADDIIGVAFDAGNGKVFTANNTSNTVTRVQY